MRSTASSTRRAAPRRRAAELAVLAAAGCLAVVAVLGAGRAHARPAQAAAQEAVAVPPGAAPEHGVVHGVDHGVDPFADRFPNLVLQTHEGKSVRFYDDLLEGKIVLINFMYATCTER